MKVLKTLKPLLIIGLLVSVFALSVVYLKPLLNSRLKNATQQDSRGGTDMVLANYGSAIDSAAALFDLPAAYLKALCMLECSGRRVFEPRFEPHVFRKLKRVKFGDISNYEHVDKAMLEDAGDDALRNLASSWGPFQLMGYKCLLLGIKVRDIRGEQGVYYGVKWINMTYGDYLRKGKYKDAFHIHNAGSPFPLSGRPKTHDPAYCSKGMAYMREFQ